MASFSSATRLKYSTAILPRANETIDASAGAAAYPSSTGRSWRFLDPSGDGASTLVQNYMRFIYPTHPIVDENDLRQSMSAMADDRVPAAFVHSCNAAVACATLSARPENSRQTILSLLGQAIELQEKPGLGFRSSVKRVLTCILIANCLMCVEESSAAFV